MIEKQKQKQRSVSSQAYEDEKLGGVAEKPRKD
jgi:hypothetical protein